MDKKLERLVWRRAGTVCEYCRMPQVSLVPFHLEHIVARQHGGPTVASNLAVACARCNFNKGPNLASLDPKTKRKVWLFNPRRHRWSRHFRWLGATIVGRTAIGRATVELLDMNHPAVVELRRSLIDEDLFPEAELPKSP